MYGDPFYESAHDAGVDIISKPAQGLLYATIDGEARDAMQAQAQAVLAQLRAFYAAPSVDDARDSLRAAIERLSDLAFDCAEDVTLSVVDSVHEFGCHLEDVETGYAQALVLPPLEGLEKALQDLIDNRVELETERERYARQGAGRLTADEWQCERDERALHRALDAQHAADVHADYYADRYL